MVVQNAFVKRKEDARLCQLRNDGAGHGEIRGNLCALLDFSHCSLFLVCSTEISQRITTRVLHGRKDLRCVSLFEGGWHLYPSNKLSTTASEFECRFMVFVTVFLGFNK